MIYFLDNSLQLQKIVTSKNVISAIHEHELNGLIRADVELDLSYANKFLVLGIDHVGYYYKDEFYLHKIQRVEYDHVNETATVVLRHIFFEDMIFGKLIRDVRPQNQDALTVSRQTIDANTRWQTIMTDVTGRLSTNFYWQVPYEVIEFMTENYRIEYLPKILFDGKKINSFQLHLANKIGEDKNIRIPYGSRVLDLKYEEDYSEIITKLVVHGKGEEIGDGYGRRINISDVNFSRNGVESPVGSLYLEDESITNAYGNDGQTPREGREVFEDIEDAKELAEAGYQHYLQVSRPQMLFTADVADIGDVGIGDSVMIIRREYDVYFNARIHKLSVDLLYPEDAQVELGDYKHFKESKISRKSREKNNRIQKQLSDRITRLKQEANERFDNEVAQWKSEYEQALIDVHAEIEADRENMTNLINTKTKEFDENLEAGMAEAERKRQENYDAMSERVTTTVDTTRAELESAISTEVTQAKNYAEQQAQEKADKVRTDLETVTSGHKELIDSLKDNVMNIDDFLGDKTKPIYEQIHDVRLDFEERISNINTWHYNMLRATRLDETEKVSVYNGSIFSWSEILQFRGGTSPGVTQSYLNFLEPVTLESNKEYTLSFDFKSEFVPETDNIWLISNDGNPNFNITHTDNRLETNIFNLETDGHWQRAYIKFKSPRKLRGTIRVGTHFTLSNTQTGTFDIRLVYLTDTGRTEWLFHQLDNTQSIDEITRRVTQLEDGRSEFITKTQFNYETGELSGSIRDILETVEESSNLIVNHENWILNEGSHTLQMADLVSSKVWMSDIHNPNLIPFSAVRLPEHRQHWLGWQTNVIGTSYQEWVRVRNTNASNSLGYQSPPMRLVAGEKYTASWLSWSDSPNFNMDFDYLFLMYASGSNPGVSKPKKIATGNTIASNPIYRYEVTFTPDRTDDNTRFLFGGRTNQTGLDTSFVMRHPKIELGERATPYNNAFSNLTQRADEMMLSVQGIGERGFLNQSDIVLRPDYVQIGSQQIDGDSIASLLRVSPTGIDVVAEAMRLSGDLYVDGDITALAVQAIEGDFARLFANNLTADVINGTHIKSNTIEIKHLTGYDAILEVLMARTVFSNEVTAKVGNYIDINAGNIVTAGLSANVITSDHIQVGTALIDKFFATSARIDQLITKTHFVNEMHALTLNVIELNASQIRTRLLSANTIEAEWLKGGTALLDRVFASTAMFERMMAKSAFVTTLSTITLDLHELTIWRPDGVAVIQNGMQRFGLPVTFVQQVSGGGAGDVFIHPNYWETNARGAQEVGGIYTEHAGRWLNVGVGVGLRADADHASTKMGVVIRPSNIPSGASWPSAHIEEFTVYRGSTHYYNISVPLGRPTFGAASWTLEFYRIGDNNRNPVQLRRRRIWISA